ncbi:MAG: tRNA (adenosine(37)-N6)-threonylcarbamoyltransferase complex ATPase subunit type 1 TsaE [Candidatus Taylorbacteria bacterium]
MKSTTSHSLIETENLAKEWLSKIVAGANDAATIVALNGQLGSGKTTFVQAVARELGIVANVTSPTFVIMKKYKLGGGKSAGVTHFKTLIHIDAYRLESGDDLSALEFADITADPGNLILIEWADNVKGGLPADIEEIDFEYVSENERKISFK